jgi:imidazole glycerol-phosphate synthase subunit HisH
MISIIDYGIGNLGSLVNIHKRVGLDVERADTEDLIEQATHLILPGVGSFDTAIRKLDESGLRPALERAVMIRRIPILGICLGMQMMTEGSEEGVLDGLSWIKGNAKRFILPDQFKIPHVGWNKVKVIRKNFLLDEGSALRYYFVHSFFVDCKDKTDVIGVTDHGNDFICAYHRDNIYGVQFHPEKSHSYGKNLLTSFANI